MLGKSQRACRARPTSDVEIRKQGKPAQIAAAARMPQVAEEVLEFQLQGG